MRMTDYQKLSKAELIARLRALEEKSRVARPAHAELADTRQQLDKLDQSALHDSEERLRAILQTAVEAIITIDERGIIESLNPAAERTFGYQPAEVIGRNVSMLMPSPDRERHDSYLENYVRTGHAKIIGIGREVLAQRKDGSVFPIDLAVSEVRLARRRLFTGFIRDISERKRAELRQKVLYATTRSLAEAATLAEAAPKILRSICEQTGWGLGEFWSVDEESRVLRYVGTGNMPGVEAPEFARLAANLTFACGVGLPGKSWASGKPLWVANLAGERDFLRAEAAVREQIHSAVTFPVLLGAEVHGVMVFFSREMRAPDAEMLDLFADIGSQIGQFIERKKAEEKLAELARTLAEKNKELETIVYVASHDLRSPLVNIQGFSNELALACNQVRVRLMEGDGAMRPPELRELLAQDIPEALEYIQAGVAKIDSLLAGFLRYSRLGRAALRIERLNMNSMIAGIVQAMEFQIKQAGAVLDVGNLPDVLGDATQINQVFSNLLENAVKYLDPKRPGAISIGGSLDAGRAIFVVRDNGIGIIPEHQDKVFEIFHRLNPAAGEGEGLGLTIAQRILERQNGKIWVESRLDQGTAFFVSLPAPPPTKGPA